MSEHGYDPKNQSPQGYVDELLSGKKETDDPAQLALLQQISDKTQQIAAISLSVAALRFDISVVKDLRSRLHQASQEFQELSSSAETLSEELGVLNQSPIDDDVLPGNRQVIKVPDKDGTGDVPPPGAFFAEDPGATSEDILEKAPERANTQEEVGEDVLDGTENTFSLSKKDMPHRIHGFIDAVAGLPKYGGHGAPSLEEGRCFTQEVVMVYLTPDKEIEPDGYARKGPFDGNRSHIRSHNRKMWPSAPVGQRVPDHDQAGQQKTKFKHLCFEKRRLIRLIWISLTGQVKRHLTEGKTQPVMLDPLFTKHDDYTGADPQKCCHSGTPPEQWNDPIMPGDGGVGTDPFE